MYSLSSKKYCHKSTSMIDKLHSKKKTTAGGRGDVNTL